MSLQESFPLLATEGFSPASPATENYNCIAWAAGCQEGWWWPDAAFVSYWPEQAPRTETLEAFFAAFALLGYEPCENGQFEQGFEKVAFFLRDGKPTHAARQLSNGSWTNKLGSEIDITHTLRRLEGPLYGKVAAFIKRPCKPVL